MRYFYLISLCLLSIAVHAQKKGKMTANKKAVIANVDNRSAELIEMSDKIWAFEETAFEEFQSAKTLADYAESQGFTVKRGVAGIPTAFTAEFGSGSPIIGIMGEFDALPGLSQQTVPEKAPLNEGGAGHGCGHNMFGVASLGAATVIKDLIASGELEGTVRFYGTPAEERFFGKLWMVREGLFEDLDICMDWHPSDEIKADVQSSLALVDFRVEFWGQAAHASGDPWNGKSTLDALELYTTGINYLREHIMPTVRIHYHIEQGSNVVNVVPDYSSIWTRVRDTRREGMEKVWKRVEQIAEGAALMANVDYKISLISGVHEVLVNRTGGAELQKNIELLGEITYTDEEQDYAVKIQEATEKEPIGMNTSINPLEETLAHPMGGSTDVGDVSWVVPVIRMRASVAPADVPWHSWAVVACGGMSIGHKGMLYATKALAMTMTDLYEKTSLREEVKKEFAERKGDYVYKGIVPEGPPPLPSNE